VAQGCVLLMNVYWNVRQMSRSMQRAIVDMLKIPLPARAFIGEHLTAALCGVSHCRVRRVYGRLKSRAWCPDQRADLDVVRDCARLEPEAPAQVHLEEISARVEEHSPEIQSMMIFVR